MLRWFDGLVACEETKRCLDNLKFCAVTRARPEDEAVDNSDDDYSDEELHIDASSFEDIGKTRMGSGSTKAKDVVAEDGETYFTQDGADVDANVKASFDVANKLWEPPAGQLSTRHAQPPQISGADLERALAAAAASQRQEHHSDKKTRACASISST